eukprot:596252_1
MIDSFMCQSIFGNRNSCLHYSTISTNASVNALIPFPPPPENPHSTFFENSPSSYFPEMVTLHPHFTSRAPPNSTVLLWYTPSSSPSISLLKRKSSNSIKAS